MKHCFVDAKVRRRNATRESDFLNVRGDFPIPDRDFFALLLRKRFFIRGEALERKRP